MKAKSKLASPITWRSAARVARASPRRSSIRPATPASASPPAEQLPPEHPPCEPDEQVEQRNKEPDPPPGSLGHVPRAEEHRSRPGAVVGEARVEVGIIGEPERRQQRRRAGRERRG